MKLIVEISAPHDDLVLYQSEINNLFAIHGVPESYSVRITKSSLKRDRPETVENDANAEDVDFEEDDESTAKVARVENGKGGKKEKSAKGKGIKGTKGRGKGAKGGKGSAQPRYTGTIRKWNATRGYYFVACPELQPRFQCDVVLTKKDVPAGADIGSKITFVAMQSDELRNPVAHKARLV